MTWRAMTIEANNLIRVIMLAGHGAGPDDRGGPDHGFNFFGALIHDSVTAGAKTIRVTVGDRSVCLIDDRPAVTRQDFERRLAHPSLAGLMMRHAQKGWRIEQNGLWANGGCRHPVAVQRNNFGAYALEQTQEGFTGYRLEVDFPVGHTARLHDACRRVIATSALTARVSLDGQDMPTASAPKKRAAQILRDASGRPWATIRKGSTSDAVALRLHGVSIAAPLSIKAPAVVDLVPASAETLLPALQGWGAGPQRALLEIVLRERFAEKSPKILVLPAIPGLGEVTLLRYPGAPYLSTWTAAALGERKRAWQILRFWKEMVGLSLDDLKTLGQAEIIPERWTVGALSGQSVSAVRWHGETPCFLINPFDSGGALAYRCASGRDGSLRQMRALAIAEVVDMACRGNDALTPDHRWNLQTRMTALWDQRQEAVHLRSLARDGHRLLPPTPTGAPSPSPLPVSALSPFLKDPPQ